MRTPVQAGTTVIVRGRRWLLRSTVTRADCRELHLEPAAHDRAGESAKPVVLLEPFDRPMALGEAGTVRVVSRRAWMAALRAALLARRAPDGLAAAAAAKADLLPHQLEPAIAVVHRGATRLLLADAVGLGKTIEAGFVLAELRERAMLDRALVLAPPGLCDQWCAELSGRFGLDAAVADAGWLRRLRPVLPPGVNPWSIPGIRVASLDFAKRPEVRHSAGHLLWDALVVDEAHLAAGDSERRAAADALASQARVVLLLTATPHNGDSRTFLALCRIGALHHADSIVMFRRTRQEAGIGGRRRVHLLRLAPTRAEREVRKQLDGYVKAVWVRPRGADGREARLAMTVLLKRSLSGMAPLRRSLATRLDRLGDPGRTTEEQLWLSWGDEDDTDAAPGALLGAPGLADAREERRVLASLLEGAALAERDDSKLRALDRLLGRVHEPAIVFTEYRDTLESLRTVTGGDTVVLHGAMDRFERADAVRRFNSGRARVLLATDAAGEGLNLQQGCRLVVNLELPWNPMRLEQRIGRVDRIGQRRTVHAVNLVASDTAEADILARLAARLDRARRSVGELEDVLGPGDDRLVATWLGLAASAEDRSRASSAARDFPPPRLVRQPDLCAAGADAVRQLAWLRKLAQAARGSGRASAGRSDAPITMGILATAVRRSCARALGGREGLLVVFLVHQPSSPRAGTFGDLTPVFAAGRWPRMRRRRDVRACAAAALKTMVPRMAAEIPPPAALPQRDTHGVDRDALLAARSRARRTVQRGLFDGRAEREADAIEDARSADDAASACGQASLAPTPLLLLFITP